MAEDLDLALERDEFGWDCDDFDLGSFLFRPPIFSNVFRFSFVRRARFRGLSALVLIEVLNLRFRVWSLWISGG